MNSQQWDAFGSVLGGIGGVAGLAALAMTSQDRLVGMRRRQVAIFPDDARVTLLLLLKVADQVVTKERDRDWLTKHLDPVYKQVMDLDATVQMRGKGRLGVTRQRATEMQYVEVRTNLLLRRSVKGDPEHGVESTWGVDQRDDARRVADAVRDLDKRLERAAFRADSR